jgi:heme/copper-type cytochrome/quinol oxidase subunit 1
MRDCSLVVAATWLVALNLYRTYNAWHAKYPDDWTPLSVFMALVTFTMWTIASVGLAAEMLFMLLPWSFGWIQGTDARLARTLFWFTGHPIVYFWLLPAYISWYTMVPKQAGGRLFQVDLPMVALGGTLLFISALFYFVNMAMTVAASRQPATIDIPVTGAISGPEGAPRILDRW